MKKLKWTTTADQILKMTIPVQYRNGFIKETEKLVLANGKRLTYCVGMNDVCQCILLFIEGAPKYRSRTAWVIDNGHELKHRLYLTFYPSAGVFAWTADIAEALQFSRRRDAELCAKRGCLVHQGTHFC